MSGLVIVAKKNLCKTAREMVKITSRTSTKLLITCLKVRSVNLFISSCSYCIIVDFMPPRISRHLSTILLRLYPALENSISQRRPNL